MTFLSFVMRSQKYKTNILRMAGMFMKYMICITVMGIRFILFAILFIEKKVT